MRNNSINIDDKMFFQTNRHPANIDDKIFYQANMHSPHSAGIDNKMFFQANPQPPHSTGIDNKMFYQSHADTTNSNNPTYQTNSNNPTYQINSNNPTYQTNSNNPTYQTNSYNPIESLSMENLMHAQNFIQNIISNKLNNVPYYPSDTQIADIDIAVNYMAKHMSSTNKNSPKPIWTVSVPELKYLHSYLENIKNNRIASHTNKLIPISQPFPKNRATDIYDPVRRDVPIDWRTFSTFDDQPNFDLERNFNQANFNQPNFNQANFNQPNFNQPNFNQPNFNQANFTNQQPGARGAACTRSPKKSQQSMEFGYTNDYYNPYEYGSGQKSMGILYKKPYNGSYDNSAISSSEIGLSNNMYNEKISGMCQKC